MSTFSAACMFEFLILKSVYISFVMISFFLFRNTLRMTRGAALQGTDNSANNNVYLGRHNKDFEFADLKSLQVEFVECSARGKSEESNGDTECVLEWIARVA